MSRSLEKHYVCTSCYSVTATDPNCICCYSNHYDTIELEFEMCTCCGNLVNDGYPADTEFNKKQYETSKK